MRRKKVDFENLTEDEQQQVELEKCKVQIFEAKNEIEENIIRIGQYLIIAKSWVKHGEWENWLETNVQYTKMTASRYMKAYKLVENVKEELSYNLQKLGGTKIIELSALKVEQVEEIISKENVEEMSVRELKEFVKELKQTTKKSKPKSNIDVTFKIPTSLVIQADISEIWKDTEKLNKELHIRCGSNEDLETTLIARYNAKEITHQQLIDIVAQNKLNFPIFFYKEALDEYLDRFNSDYYSDYEHYNFNEDKKEDRYYYGLFDRECEWKEAIKCYDTEDEDAIDWSRSSNIDNNTYQLSRAYVDTSEYLCIYKKYELIGQFLDGNLENIKTLCNWDKELDFKQLEVLFDKLNEQLQAYEERNTIRFAERQKEQEKRKKQKEKFDEAFDDWYKNYQPYSMGKYRFSDIWNENGDIKNFKLWREMTDFVNAEKRKQNDSWKNYDFGNLFGNSKTAIKEEDKPNYKRLYRILAKQCHPDIVKDDGALMQLANNLKEQWGI